MQGLLSTKAHATTTATDCSFQTDIPEAECETLIALYNSTDGSNWSINTGWNETNSPCSWYGITCGDGRVQEILMYYNGMIGSIPDLSTLTNLQILGLFNPALPFLLPDRDKNQLTGSIPDLSKLTNLEYLNLSYNQLSGPIPDLSTLTSLKRIQLRDNQLSGSIPDLSMLTSLEILSLENNQLSGPIPDLSTLTNLESLGLYNNQLSGPIPDLSTLTNLETLSFDNNQLSGPIPNLSTLTSLRILGLSDNQLTGAIPDLSPLTSLQGLFLSDNQLTGAIPDLSPLISLQYIWLYNNQLSGSVPASVCLAKFELDLGYNKLNVDTADSCIDTADPDWKETQTVPPTNVTASSLANASIQLTWDAIAYTQDGGYYGVWGKPQGDPTYSLLATTADKTITSTIVTGLQPDTNYEFVIRTFTPAHGDQQNNLLSVDSDVTISLTGSPESYYLFLPIIAKPIQTVSGLVTEKIDVSSPCTTR